MIIHLIEFFAMIFVFVGVILIAIPKRYGLYWFMVAQCLWIIFGILVNAPFLVLQNIILLIVNCFAIRNWKRQNIG